jgi:DhnA family fructose-bisphosphate aldolase class Ia
LGGAQLRLGRLFSYEAGRSLVIAFDHGTTLRVPLEAGRPLEVVEKIRSAPPATRHGAKGSRAVREPEEIGEAARSILSYDPYHA